MLRKIAVKVIKPILSEDAWQRLRKLDPGAAKRDVQRASRADRQRKIASEAEPASSSRSLTYLATHFATDKWGRHRYTPHYEFHLGHLKDREFTLLEIGIGGYKRRNIGGASLRMWKAYFPRAQILGLDIEDKSFVNDDRILAYRGSQTDEKLLRTIVSTTDNNLLVVIDDGSHQNEHVLRTFSILFPLLPDGAIYAIEDTQTSYRESHGGSTDPHASTTTMSMVKSLLDGLNYEEFTNAGYTPTYTELHVVAVHAYHNLVFIEKGLNNESRESPPHQAT
jgi:hypothetical protein